jgi:hypothetical protein
MPTGKGDKLVTECVTGCKGSAVISCTTFWNGLEDECGSFLVRRLICRITESVLLCYIVCMETATWNWMSDVDTAHQPVNIFNITDDGFKEVQKKGMVEAA